MIALNAPSSGTASAAGAADTRLDPPTQEALILRYLPLVRSVVNGMLAQLPRCADGEELRSVGLNGLIQAIQKFDPSQRKTFEGYAAMRIRGAILDELRRLDWMPRTARSKSRWLQGEVANLEQSLGRVPTDAEIRRHLEMDGKTFDRLKKQTRQLQFIPLDKPVTQAEGEGSDLHEAIPDESQGLSSEELEKSELADLMVEQMESLPERQRQVLAMYYFENMRLAEIAAVFGVTEARVCQIHTQALGSLRKYLNRVTR
ncbi:MAG: sigma-70 family RNA polymerase sigma factor [Opitutales bacterium]